MESKYYTPTVDEFYVGFEYEMLSADKKSWIKARLDSLGEFSGFESECYLQTHIDWGNIRVKYLDKEDIESLGFEFIETIGIKYLMFKHKTGSDLVLYLNEKPMIEIEREEPYDISFKGYCKNKSELKKLMKQLGIYE